MTEVIYDMMKTSLFYWWPSFYHNAAKKTSLQKHDFRLWCGMVHAGWISAPFSIHVWSETTFP